jgi:hypothetical protein
MSNEKIFIGIDDQRIELIGADKEAFLADRQNRLDELAAQAAEAEAKAQAKAELLERLGITADEAKLLLA